MIPRNCLSQVLDRCVTEPGYVVARASAHSDYGMHVLHAGPEGLWHYAPGATLGSPVRALTGFDGVPWERDQSDAPPIKVRALVIGSTLLMVGVWAWAVARWWRGLFAERLA